MMKYASAKEKQEDMLNYAESLLHFRSIVL